MTYSLVNLLAAAFKFQTHLLLSTMPNNNDIKRPRTSCCKRKKPQSELVQFKMRWFCGIDEAIKWSKEQANKATQKAARRDKRTMKDNDLSHQKELTQQSFNALIRELDKHLPCVSCGKPAMQYNLTAGHFKTVGARKDVRYDTRNCHGQCSGCNSGRQKFYKGDNETTARKFAAEIARRYGQEIVDYLDRVHPEKRYRIDELKALRKMFNDETRRLQRGEEPSRNWRGMDLTY